MNKIFTRIPLWLLWILLPILSISSCQPGTTAIPVIPTATISLPASGKSTVTGVILNVSTGTPHKQVLVRLAEVHRQDEQGAYILDSANSPGGYTNDMGVFVIADIEPGEYVLVVGDPMVSYTIVADENGLAKTWVAEKDKISDFGTIRVDYTP